MRQQRLAWLVVTALVVASAGTYLAARREQSNDSAGVHLLPWLDSDLNLVDSIEIRKGAPVASVIVHRRGAAWTVAERGDYPANLDRVRKLLIGMRDARIVENKTADPARFAMIGVDDPDKPGTLGVLVTMTTPTAKHAVIVGKPLGQGSFVRRAGENQTYSVEPAMTIDAEPRAWIDPQLLDLQAALIERIEVKPAAGPEYALRRAKPADNSFELEAVPAGRKALDPTALAPGPTTFTGLTADDVTTAADLDFQHAGRVTVTLSDGNVVTLSGIVGGDKHWLQLSATKDEPLTVKTRGRAFEIPGYRYDAIFKPLEQLLVPKDSKAKAPAAHS